MQISFELKILTRNFFHHCNLHFTREISIFALTLSYQAAVRWQVRIIRSERRQMTFAINYSILELSIPSGAERAIQLWCSIVKQKRQRTRKSERARKGLKWKCGFLCCQSDKKLFVFFSICWTYEAAPELTFRQNEKERTASGSLISTDYILLLISTRKKLGKLFLSLKRLIISSWRQICFIYAAAFTSNIWMKKVSTDINEPKIGKQNYESVCLSSHQVVFIEAWTKFVLIILLFASILTLLCMNYHSYQKQQKLHLKLEIERKLRYRNNSQNT